MSPKGSSADPTLSKTSNSSAGMLKFNRATEPYLYLLPAFILLILISIYPLFITIDFSLHKMKFFERQEFVGLLNYINLFKEPRFQENLVNSAVFIISSVSLQFIVGYGMALLLNRPMRYRTLVRTIILISWTISEIAVAFMWRWMLQPQFGLINPLIKLFGINQQINVFGNTDLAMITLVIASVWRGSGFTLVMILAALQAIPETLYAASKVDGASAWMIFRRITFPLTLPVVMVALIIVTLGTLNLTALPMGLTGGGPIYSTEVLSLRLYKEAFGTFRIAAASTIAAIMFILNIGLSFAYIRLLRTERHL